MEILEAFDLTGSYRAAAELAGCSHHTVARYVRLRASGRVLTERAAHDRLTDGYLAKVEEWVERWRCEVRADIVHDKLRAQGFEGSERTTRRAVARAKRAYAAGHRRVYRPWIQTKIRRATELATLVGATPVDRALGLAAEAGRFADGDLESILDHLRLMGDLPPRLQPVEAPPLPLDLARLLHRLNLCYVRQAGPAILARAREEGWGHDHLLKVLFAEEAGGRDRATGEAHRKAARLPSGKTFDAWDLTSASRRPRSSGGGVGPEDIDGRASGCSSH